MRIRPNSEPENEGGRVVYDCRVTAAVGTGRCVYFAAGGAVEDDGPPEMVVEATLNVSHLGEWVAPGGMRFEAVTEYWMEDALRWP